MRNLTRAEVERYRAGEILAQTDDSLTVNCFGGHFRLVVPKHDESLTPCLVGPTLPGLWEAWVTSWFTFNLEDGMTFLDVGANCGYYTMLAKCLGCAVYAYEPNPLLVRMLRETRDINNTYYRVYEVALGDRCDEVVLGQFGNHMGSASVVTKYTDVVHKVHMTTLDQDLSYGFIPPPDAIKIDTEAAEELIWDGGYKALKNTRFVVLEWTPGAYSDVFAQKLFHWGDPFVIDYDGSESPITVDELNELQYLRMIVVRKR